MDREAHFYYVYTLLNGKWVQLAFGNSCQVTTFERPEYKSIFKGPNRSEKLNSLMVLLNSQVHNLLRDTVTVDSYVKPCHKVSMNVGYSDGLNEYFFLKPYEENSRFCIFQPVVTYDNYDRRIKMSFFCLVRYEKPDNDWYPNVSEYKEGSRSPSFTTQQPQEYMIPKSPQCVKELAMESNKYKPLNSADFYVDLYRKSWNREQLEVPLPKLTHYLKDLLANKANRSFTEFIGL